MLPSNRREHLPSGLCVFDIDSMNKQKSMNRRAAVYITCDMQPVQQRAHMSPFLFIFFFMRTAWGGGG